MRTSLVYVTKDNSLIVWYQREVVQSLVWKMLLLDVAAQEGDHSLFCPKGSFWPHFPWYEDGEQMERVQ